MLHFQVTQPGTAVVRIGRNPYPFAQVSKKRNQYTLLMEGLDGKWHKVGSSTSRASVLDTLYFAVGLLDDAKSII